MQFPSYEISHWRKAACLAVAIIFVLLIPCAFAQGAGYWHTSGNQILDSNNQHVRIAAINWYGFETTDELVHGLWAQDYHTILNEIKSNGYNTIRLPFSNQMIENPIMPTNFTQFANGQAANTDLVGLNALQIMDKIVQAAAAINLRIILDNHRSNAGNSAAENGLWYISGTFPETAWINDWTTLTTRYSSLRTADGNPVVIGMDLRNEPHLNATGGATGACWTGDTSTAGCPTSNTAQNWPAAATRAGNAVQAINPSLLIIVEGAECYNGDCDWWGGNLEGVATNPVTLNVANRLVYSPHDYGPSIFQQSWFNSSTTFTSLSANWNKFWGYISANGTAPIWVGEFGTGNAATDVQNTVAGSEGQWFQSLVMFLQNNPNLNWSYWALNGEDSFALLDGQYSVVANPQKQSMLAAIQFPLSGGGAACATVPSAPTGTTATAISSSQINLSWNAVTPPANCTVSYSVFRSMTTGFTPAAGNQVASGLTATAFSDSGLAASTTFFYKVEAVDAAGSSPASTQASATTQAAPAPNFLLAASPATLTVNRGASGTSTITITRTNGFASAVAFTASGLPAGVTASFNPATTTTTGTSSVLTLTASSTATLGAATITVTGTGGSLTHTTTVALTVVAAATPDFSLSASPASLTVNRGASGTSTISITRLNSFASTVSFTASGLPTGVTVSFNPATTTTTGTSSVLTLTASSTATLGAATVTITGTGGSLTHTTTVSLTVATAAGGTGGVTLTPVVSSSSGFFNEEDLKLVNTASLTALSVTIVVQRTTGVSFSGQFNTVGGTITQANSSTASAVTYTFTLNAGQTLTTGTGWTFAAQTSGTGTAHPTVGDTFTVTYTTGGQNFSQTGHF